MAEPLLTAPESWERISLDPNPLLGFIKSVSSGGTPRTSTDTYWGGEIPWLTPKEVSRNNNGVYVSQTERLLTKEGLKASSAKLQEPNSVLLTKRAPVGAVAVNAVPMATNQGFLCFQCGENLHPLYLAHWLRINRGYLNKVANGSTYPELYSGDLFEFTMAVPPLLLQKQILQVVSALKLIAGVTQAFEKAATSPDGLAASHAQREHLKKLQDRLLPLLFSGKLKPPSEDLELTIHE